MVQTPAAGWAPRLYADGRAVEQSPTLRGTTDHRADACDTYITRAHAAAASTAARLRSRSSPRKEWATSRASRACPNVPQSARRAAREALDSDSPSLKPAAAANTPRTRPPRERRECERGGYHAAMQPCSHVRAPAPAPWRWTSPSNKRVGVKARERTAGATFVWHSLEALAPRYRNRPTACTRV